MRWVVLLLLVAMPADHAPAGPGPGPLTRQLRRVEATQASRVETLIDRFAPSRPESDNETHSLAADPDVWPLAVALDAIGVDVATFTTDVFRFRDDRGGLQRYRALAVGSGQRATGPFMVVAMTMADRAGASEQLGRLDTLLRSGASVAARRPWSDLLQIERLERHDRIVVALLTTRVQQLWIDLERHPDTLLWWR